MAFATQYRLVCYNNKGDQIYINMQYDGFAGSVTEVYGGTARPMLTYTSSSEDKFDPIVSSRLSFSINQIQNWQYKDLWFSGPKEYKVILYNNTKSLTLWQGWKEPWSSSEPLDTPAFDLNISCTDWLNELDSIDYPNTSSTAQGAAINMDTILYDNILNETGLGLDINHNIDTFENNFATTSSQNFITQLYLMIDALYDDDGNFLTCGDILRNILTSLGARIFQAPDIDNSTAASWIIQQVNLTGSQTWYNWEGTTNSSSTIDYTYNFPIDNLPLAGGNYSLIPAKNTIYTRHEEAFIENLIEGDFRRGSRVSNFTADDFPTSTTLDNWGTLTNTNKINNFAGSWTTKTFSGSEGKATTDLGIALRWDNPQHRIPLAEYSPNATISDNGSGKIQVAFASAHGYSNPPTNEYLMLYGFGYCDGVHGAMTYIDSTTMDLEQSFDSTGVTTGWASSLSLDAGTWEGIEATVAETNSWTTSIEETATTSKLMKISAQFKIEGTNASLPAIESIVLPMVVVSIKSGTDFRFLRSDGYWSIGPDAAPTPEHWPMVMLTAEVGKSEWGTAEYTTTLTSGQNYYTTGSPEIYVAIMEPFITPGHSTTVNTEVYIDNIKITILPTTSTSDDEESASAGGANYPNNITVTSKYFDAPEEDWSEKIYHNGYLWSNSGRYTHTANWKTKAATPGSKRLQDFLADIYADLYDVESITARFGVDGFLTPQRTIKDFLNFERNYLITSLSVNIESDESRVTAIEVNPEGEKSLIQDISSGVATDLNGVSMINNNLAYICGASDVVRKWDGSSFSAMTTGSSGVTFETIFALDQYNVFVGGSGGNLYGYNGTSWASRTSGTTQTINCITALRAQRSASIRVWYGMADGTIRYVSDWTSGSVSVAQTSNISTTVEAIAFKGAATGDLLGDKGGYGVSTQDSDIGVAVGEDSGPNMAIVYTNDSGTTWTQATFSTQAGRLWDVWNIEGTDTWMASGLLGGGYNSGNIVYISHNNGQNWSTLYEDSSSQQRTYNIVPSRKSWTNFWGIYNYFVSYDNGVLVSRETLSNLYKKIDREKLYRFNENGFFNKTANGWTAGSWDFTTNSGYIEATSTTGTAATQSFTVKKDHRYTVFYSFQFGGAINLNIDDGSLTITAGSYFSKSIVLTPGDFSAATSALGSEEFIATADASITLSASFTQTVGIYTGVVSSFIIREEQNKNEFGHYAFSVADAGKVKKAYLY